MTDFNIALREESAYPATENIIRTIYEASTVVKLKKKEVLIDSGQICRDIFFVTEGCIRGTIMNSDGSECTVGFGLCGSMIHSAICFTDNLPSFYKFQACCPTELLRIKKADCDELILRNHEFCRWLMGAFELRILFSEMRNENLNGNATIRYKNLIKIRPEIFNLVPDKMTASYLNISEVHLSRIKKKVLLEGN